MNSIKWWFIKAAILVESLAVFFRQLMQTTIEINHAASVLFSLLQIYVTKPKLGCKYFYVLIFSIMIVYVYRESDQD